VVAYRQRSLKGARKPYVQGRPVRFILLSFAEVVYAVFRLTLGTLALCCVGVATVRAQDPVKVAPNNFTVLLENDQVRVLDFHSKGEKIPMHSHPKYLTYDIAGSGKTIFTWPDGKTTEGENKPGQTTWGEATTHASQSTGEIHALLVELKAKPAKKM